MSSTIYISFYKIKWNKITQWSMFKLVAWILYMTVSNVESTRLGWKCNYNAVPWDRSGSVCQIRFSLRKLTTGHSRVAALYYTCTGHVLICFMVASTSFLLSETFTINAILQLKSVYTDSDSTTKVTKSLSRIPTRFLLSLITIDNYCIYCLFA